MKIQLRLCFICMLLLQCFAFPLMGSTTALREYFSDILLIINFNRPFYNNIEFLKEIYAPYFPNIVFYGEGGFPDVNKINHNLGWYVHRAMKDAMVKWPKYKGYICCQDDCFMNFWNFARLDKNKIWLHSYWIQSLNGENKNWPWWNMPCGQAAMMQAYKKLPPKNSAILEKNCGSEASAYTWADFFYVPDKYREEFINLSQCFDNPNVFIEIAIPTLILSLEEYDKIEHLNPYWGGTIKSIPLETYDTQFDWVHPIKFSSEANRQFIRDVISHTVKSNRM